jgi:hypothetical protein
MESVAAVSDITVDTNSNNSGDGDDDSVVETVQDDNRLVTNTAGAAVSVVTPKASTRDKRKNPEEDILDDQRNTDKNRVSIGTKVRKQFEADEKDQNGKTKYVWHVGEVIAGPHDLEIPGEEGETAEGWTVRYDDKRNKKIKEQSQKN